jgi:hypothetical protein
MIVEGTFGNFGDGGSEFSESLCSKARTHGQKRAFHKSEGAVGSCSVHGCNLLYAVDEFISFSSYDLIGIMQV